ncbi:MAG: hypothetical protein IPP68_04100 [Elusimicrobia bacterium]|nr:hypothetical protein [Elusimicrobiota bacterium]
MAQLPATVPTDFSTLFTAPAADRAPASLSQLPASLGRLESIQRPSTAAPLVILIQDAHRVPSAQLNISLILARLQAGARSLLVGVEGAAGPFRLGALRRWTDVRERDAVAGCLVRGGVLNGAEHFGVVSAAEPSLWGVEAPEEYLANVAALRESAARRGAVLERVDRWARDVDALRDRFLTPEAREWDDALDRYDRAGESVVDFAAALGKSAPGPLPSEVAKLLRVVALEKDSPRPAVEADRSRALERLVPLLTSEETARLLDNTAAFRLGRLSAAHYYGGWRALAARHRIPWGGFPSLAKYTEAVGLAETISPTLLYDQMESLRYRTTAALARSSTERNVLELSADLRTLRRLAALELTASDWSATRRRRSAFETLETRLSALTGTWPQTDAQAWRDDLRPGFAFYETAEKRNGALADNLLARAKAAGADTVALVAGGFHSAGLVEAFKARGTATAVLTPTIGQWNAASSSVDAFTVERTPLERLLMGQKLDLAPPSALADRPLDEPGLGAMAERWAGLGRGAWQLGVQERAAGFEDWAENQGIPVRGVKFQEERREARVSVGGVEADIKVVPGFRDDASGDSPLEESGVNGRLNLQSQDTVVTGEVSPVQRRAPFSLQRLRVVGRWALGLLPETVAFGVLVSVGAVSLSGMSWGGGLALAVLGGVGLRGFWKWGTLWHGWGHLWGLEGWAPRVWAARLTAYDPQGWSTLVPGVRLSWSVLGGLAPTLAVASTVSAARLRWAAVLGPVFSLLAAAAAGTAAVAHAFPPVGDLALWSFSAVNGLLAAASWSDFAAFWRGRAVALHCGVIGVVFGGPNPGARAMPTALSNLLDKATRRTLHRGGQSGGVASVVARENGHIEIGFRVEKTAKEKNRRAPLAALMAQSRDRLGAAADKDGFGGLSKIVSIAHTRYGTNLAPPVAQNAHPHMGESRTETILFVGDRNRHDAYERSWEKPAGPGEIKNVSAPRGVAIAHNGDDNATVAVRWPDGRVMEISNDDDALISERLTGFRPSGKGDSPQIATRLDRWITQGSVRSALSLALLMTGLSALPRGSEKKFDEAAWGRVPTAAAVAGAMQIHALETFGKDVASLLARFPEAKSLEDLYARAGGPSAAGIDGLTLEETATLVPGSALEGLRDRLAEHTHAVLSGFEWCRDADPGTREATARQLADLFLKYFFTGDLRRAGLHLVRRADTTSTYGLMASSLSEPESALWARSNQPFYLWISDDGRSVAGSSESTAFLGSQSGDSPFAHRLTLANGEVAFLSGTRLTIDHATKGRVAEFDLTDPAGVFAHRRWLDLRKSRRVPAISEDGDAPETRVRDDFNRVPKVEKAIAADFQKRSSDNAKTGRAFADQLLERLLARDPNDAGLDLVIVGTEKSFDEGKTFGELLEKISSLAGRRLRTETVYGADFTREDLIRLRDRGFNEHTLVLGLASSGQTANTFYTLENLFEAWRALTETNGGDGGATPPHFLVSSHMDNPYTEELLGQGLGDGEPFKERNFVTFPAPLDPFHPAEAATVTHKAAERLLKEVALLVARRLASQRSWAGSRLTAKTVSLIRKMIDNGDELDRRIVGLDEDGNPHVNSRGEVNDVPRQIEALGKKLRQALLENLWTAAATALFVLGTLELHATPASVLLGWFPNSAFVFAGGLPLLAGLFGVAALGVGAWKSRLRWHPFLALLGACVLASAGIFLGDVTVLALDAAGTALGYKPWGMALGVLPLPVDASPVTLLNAASYVFFSAAFMLGLRKAQGRLLWDRFLGRVLVVVDPLHANARLSAARWRRMLNLRFGWMGLYSVNESSLGRMTHEEAPNTNVRGTLYLQNESRVSESATAMNFKQLGGSPNGPGHAWRMGIGHKPIAEANAAFTEGYVSLAMADDNPAGTDADLLTLQEYFQDAGARDTAGMALALNVAEGLANIRPLNFVIGQTSSEAKTSTTQQPHPPLPAGVVREVFGAPIPAPKPSQRARPRAPRKNAGPSNSSPGVKVVEEPAARPSAPSRLETPTASAEASPSEAAAIGSSAETSAGRTFSWRSWAPALRGYVSRALKLTVFALMIGVFLAIPGSQSRFPEVQSAVLSNLRMAGELALPAGLGRPEERRKWDASRPVTAAPYCSGRRPDVKGKYER